MAGLPEGLPATKQFDLVGHGKAVVALEADAAGSRLVAGSNDYTVHLYDFGGLKADGKGFRSFEPTEGHPVVAVTWSPTGDAFMVVTSYAQVSGWVYVCVWVGVWVGVALPGGCDAGVCCCAVLLVAMFCAALLAAVCCCCCCSLRLITRP